MEAPIFNIFELIVKDSELHRTGNSEFYSFQKRTQINDELSASMEAQTKSRLRLLQIIFFIKCFPCIHTAELEGTTTGQLRNLLGKWKNWNQLIFRLQSKAIYKNGLQRIQTGDLKQKYTGSLSIWKTWRLRAIHRRKRVKAWFSQIPSNLLIKSLKHWKKRGAFRSSTWIVLHGITLEA